MKEVVKYTISDRRHCVKRHRRISLADMCIATYRPLLSAISLGNRLWQLLCAVASLYLLMYYQGYEMPLIGLAGLLAVSGNIWADILLARSRRRGEDAQPLFCILFMFSLILAAVPAAAFLLTSGNVVAVSTCGIGELWHLCTSSAAVLPGAFVLICIWWGIFVILFKEKNLQEALRLKANQL